MLGFNIEDREGQFKLMAILGSMALILASAFYYLPGIVYEPYTVKGKIKKHDGGGDIKTLDVRVTNLDTGEYLESDTSDKGKWQVNLGNLPSGYDWGDVIRAEIVGSEYRAEENHTLQSGETQKDFGDMTPNMQPVADIVGTDRSADKNDQVDLSGGDSFDNDTNPVDTLTYKWDYDDSDGLDWDNPDDTGLTTSFVATSTVTVTLQVDDNTGLDYDTDTDSIVVTISNQAPTVVGITHDQSGDPDPTDNVEYTCDATDPDEDSLQYRWDWNNDASWDTSYTSSNSSSTTFASGTHTPKCQAYDGYLTDSEVDTSTLYVNYTYTFTLHSGWTPFAMLFNDGRYNNASSLMDDESLNLHDDSGIIYWDYVGQNYSDGYFTNWSEAGDDEDFNFVRGNTYFINNPGLNKTIVIKGRLWADRALSFTSGWYYLPYAGVEKTVANHYETLLPSSLTEAMLIDHNDQWFSTSYISGFHDAGSDENFALTTGVFVLINFDSSDSYTWRYQT